MRKVKTRGGGIMILLMMVIVATNVIASQPPKCRPTGRLTALLVSIGVTEIQPYQEHIRRGELFP